jgi:deoxyribodipyrimidine photo-lyase
MVTTGWMHNYLRTYWAKKILEWSPSPSQAYQLAVRLNDKYELDGRDPKRMRRDRLVWRREYDRPRFECPIFGLIRYMSGASTGKKFDSKKYMQQNLFS